ncbi:unnamed protein product [Cunninghamella echinulata]
MILTLEELLKDTTTLSFQAFSDYLQQQYCIENLLFWIAVEQYKHDYKQEEEVYYQQQQQQQLSKDRIHQCLNIIYTYIQPNSNKEINIPCEMRVDILTLVFEKQTYHPSIFFPASQAVFELMRANSFIPWLSEWDPSLLPSPPPSTVSSSPSSPLSTSPSSSSQLPSSPITTTTTTTYNTNYSMAMVSSLSSPCGWNDHYHLSTTTPSSLTPRASISSFRSINDNFLPSGLILEKNKYHHQQKLGLRQQSLLKRVKASFVNITLKSSHRKK